MGNFYTNYTLRGPTQHAVAAALAGRRALVTPSQNDCVVVFDEASDEQDQELIANLASKLSREFSCPVLAILNHDDDILWYQLYLSGKLFDEYDSTPGYFDSTAKPSPPRGGDASMLCQAFGAIDVAEVDRVLHTSTFAEDGYVFAYERHADLVRSLQIPEFAVGTGYASFRYNEYPEGLSTDVMLSALDPPASPTREEKELQQDRDYYDKLGPEDSQHPCKCVDCKRGSILNSVFCKRHHFKMIRQRDCPFDG